MFKTLLSVLFPSRCVACGELIDDGEFLCEFCHEMIEVCPADKLCLKCGCEKKSCSCADRVYYFEKISAPFINTGIARSVVYSYKFQKKEQIAEFIAQRMALCFKQTMFDTHIDLVCSVPMNGFERFRRGFDHSGILAKRVAELLSLKTDMKLLKSHIKKHRQHKTDLKERFDNVRGIYYTESRLNGENILLIDDIKTTGATLSECAHVLLKAGAGSVYCLTALTTSRKKKGKKNGN